MSLATRVDAALETALGSRIVGCVVLVSQRGELSYVRAAGFADREAATPVVRDTIFRLASVTKPIVAATTLRMVDLGLLSLDDKVTKYLPYFTPTGPDGAAVDITIRQLLTHTSGITYNIPADVSGGAGPGEAMPLTENLRRLARAPLAFAPGTQWEYGMSIDVLGGVLAAINRSDLETVVAKYTTGPLGMDDTHFFVTDPARLAVAYADGRPPVRMDDPHAVPDQKTGAIGLYSPGRIFRRDVPQAGGAGMAGTADDLMKLFHALRGDFLSPATRAAAFANQIGALDRNDPGQRFTFLGSIVTDTASSGWPVEGMLQWGGIWGNNWMIDPASETIVVAYTNTMFEGCNGPFRDELRDAVFG